MWDNSYTMTTLYLDLEETVIRSWSNQTLCNVSKVRQFLNDNLDVDRGDVRVFSFAIYNDKDKDEFVRFIKPMLEQALGVTITQWPSVFDMAEASQKLTGARWLDADTMGGLDICEYISIVGKVRSFEDWVLYHATDNSRSVLIDDIVPSKTVIHHDRALVINYVNVVKNL